MKPLVNPGITSEEIRKLYSDLIIKLMGEVNYRQYNTLANAIQTAAENVFILPMRSPLANNETYFFSKDSLTSFIKSKGTIQESKIDDADKLTDAERNTDRANVNKQFLHNAYGIATDVQMKAQKEASVEFMNACVVNFGLGCAVRTNEDLNKNLLAYQQRLANTVIEYLIEKYDKLTDKSIVSDPRSELGDNPNSELRQMYDENGNYTGLIDRISKYNQILDPKDKSGSTLILMSESNKEDDKKFLDAYNAWQILTHFDSMLDIVFGKAITINYFGDCVFEFKDKYSFSDKAGSNETNWNDSDEINLADRISKIVQTIITSIPLLDANNNDSPIKDQYLSIDQLQNILYLIKKIPNNTSEKFTVDLNENDIYTDEELKIILKYGGLHDGKFNENGSQSINESILDLNKLINNVGENPEAIFPVIFKTLTHFSEKINEFIPNNKFKFSGNVLNVLHSLNKYVFNSQSETVDGKTFSSLNVLTGGLDIGNYYSHITQSCDTIFKIDFSQYFKDSQGVLHIRQTNSGIIERTMRALETAIKVKNSRFLQQYSKHKSDYDIKVNTEESGKLKNVSLKVGDIDIIATGSNINSTLNDLITSNQKQKILEFVNEMLNLNLTENDVEVLYELSDESSLDKLYKNLLNFAADVAYVQAVSNEYLVDGENQLIRNKTTISNKLKGVKNKPKYDLSYQELNLVRENVEQNLPTLKLLGEFYSLKQNNVESSQIKSGDGNARSASVLSRLLSRHQQQFEGHIRGNRDAAAR